MAASLGGAWWEREAVVARLRYLSAAGDASPTGTTPAPATTTSTAVYRASEPGGPVPEHAGRYDDVEVSVRNGRRLQQPGCSLPADGFALVEHRSAVRDFYSDVALSGTYNTELEALLLRVLPAARAVHVFDHTRRCATEALRTLHRTREPSIVVHNDYSKASGFWRLERELASDGGGPALRAKLAAAGLAVEAGAGTGVDAGVSAGAGTAATSARLPPFAIVNVWRPVCNPVTNHGMVFCRVPTIDAEDIRPTRRESKDGRRAEIELAVHGGQHEWVDFPHMGLEEAVVFQTFSSTGRQGALHTSFTDPTADPGRPPRQSIESRCFVFLAPE